MIDRYFIRTPWPPSVGHYYDNAARRTKQGKSYIGRKLSAEALLFHGEVLRLSRIGHQPAPRLSGHLSVWVWGVPPALQRKRDLDNTQKALWDAFTKAGIIDDDSSFDEMRVARAPAEYDGHLLVLIRPADRDAIEREFAEAFGHRVESPPRKESAA